MNQDTDPDLVLKRYLLGQLPPNETLAVEERLFLDEEYAETLQAVEEDLIDDYLYQDLTPAEQRDFEQNFLVTEERRESVTVARALKKYLKANPTPAPEPPAKWSLVVWLRQANAWWQIPLAVATLVLVLVGAWWLVRAVWMAPPQEARTPPGDNRNENLPAPKNNNSEVGPPDNKDQRVQQQNQNGEVPVPPKEPERDRPALAVTLSTVGPSRSSEEYPNRIDIGTAGQLNLKLPLVDEIDSGRFQATLLTESGKVIQTWPSLSATMVHPPNKVCTISVPTERLSPQRYRIQLALVEAGGVLQDIRTYYFWVSDR